MVTATHPPQQSVNKRTKHCGGKNAALSNPTVNGNLIGEVPMAVPPNLGISVGM